MSKHAVSLKGQHKESLVRYSAMLTAIEQCCEVDEVKAIHDKALALECYAQQAMNFDAERQAAEIRIRAERRTGNCWRGCKKTQVALSGGKSRYRQTTITGKQNFLIWVFLSTNPPSGRSSRRFLSRSSSSG